MNNSATADQLHILRGKMAAVLNVREVLEILLASDDPAVARQTMQKSPMLILPHFFWLYGLPAVEFPDNCESVPYLLDEAQVEAVLEINLNCLTLSERVAVLAELQEAAMKMIPAIIAGK